MVGQWKYNALLLTDFHPLEAERVFMEATACQILTALISKKAYQHHE